MTASPIRSETLATMPVVNLLALADRETHRLTDDNDHGAATIMMALTEVVRRSLLPSTTVLPTRAENALVEPAAPTVEEMRKVYAAVANAHRLIRGDCPGAAGDVLRTVLDSTAAYQVPATEPANG